jgi:hypothetical protein
MGYIIAAIMAVATLIWGLIVDRRNLKDKLAKAKSEGAMQEWSDKIKEGTKNVDEKDRDYARIRDEYLNKHPDDSK